MDISKLPLATYGSPLSKSSSGQTELRTDEFNPKDGKSLLNPPRADGGLSPLYKKWVEGIDPTGKRGGFDLHIYHLPNNPVHAKYARELHEAIRREFPEMEIYRFWDKAIGPHPIPQFEVNVYTPAELGTLVAYLAVKRGPCSVLIHPNTSDEVADHTTLATWMGTPIALDVDLLKAVETVHANKG